MLKANGIKKSFGKLEVLKGVDVTIHPEEVVSIVGASGAGKTTLLQILGTLDKPNEGTLLFGEKELASMGDRQLAKFRNEHIGFIFQSHHLLPEFTALENVCIPAYIKGCSKKNAEQGATRLLDMLGLSERMKHKPSELSGGENQRVAVARALINEPAIVFADEPTGNLDTRNKDELNALFFRLQKELKQTFVIVTHDEEFANTTDRKLVMKDGLIIAEQ